VIQTILKLTIVALLSTAAYAQDSLNVSLVARWYPPWLESVDLAVSGNYAYLSNDAQGLYIVDVFDPTSPVETGHCALPDEVIDAAVSGNYAYVADGNAGVRVVDVSNPTAPHEVASLQTPGQYASDIFVQGNYLYVAEYLQNGGMQIIDISDPLHPLARGYFPRSFIYNLAVAGSYAYLSAGASLVIVDVSDPSNPLQVGSYGIGEFAYGLDYAAGYVYFLNEYFSSVFIIDVSDPTNPTQAAGYPINFPTSLEVNGTTHRLYVSDGYNLEIVDVSDPTQPTQVGAIPGSTLDHPMVASDDGLLYGINGTAGLAIWDVSNSQQPQWLSACQTNGPITDVLTSGNHACLVEGVGLRMMDISNPNNPFEISFFPSIFINEAKWIGNFIYTAGNDGFKIIDASDPTHLYLVGSLSLAGYMNTAVAVAGNYAYVVQQENGIWIIDITDLLHPVLAGHWSSLYPSHDIEVYEEFAFVNCWMGGARIVNVADPANPFEVGWIDNADCGLALWENWLYTGSEGWPGVYIYYISDPQNPIQCIDIDPPGVVMGKIAGENGYLYVKSYYQSNATTIWVYNVRTSWPPLEVGHYKNPEWTPGGIGVSGNYAFAAPGGHLAVYDCAQALAVKEPLKPSLPTHFALLPPTPNPFNPSTVLSYELRVPSPVSLRIYDTAGRLVATLVNGRKEAGTHTATFDGSRLASGIYLAKLQAGDFTATQKLVLLK
jgi:hypothetical protein